MRPAVDYVSSPNGPLAGGNTVHIVGAAFAGATSVHFGDVPATSFTVLSANEHQRHGPGERRQVRHVRGRRACARSR